MDLDITIPSGGIMAIPALVKVTNIPINSPGAAVVTVTGPETLSGSSTATLVLSEAGPIAFSVSTGSLTGSCSAIFSFAGTVSLSNLSNMLKLSVQVVQEEFAVSRITSGTFVDASKAAGFAVSALRGLREPNAFQANGNGASFHARGLSAGELGLPLGVWGNLGYTKSENNLGTARSDSKHRHESVGADLTLDNCRHGGGLRKR
jgi:hypothetical protein